jgi:magnesium-protoporphyrin O-methyltransferase
MTSTEYIARRGEIEAYFDRTAVDAWRRLTSDAPVSGIRATVRAGRDRMRNLLLSWLPEDLTGARLLDAGCGTGALAVEAARRGAHVVAIDLSPTLIGIARERAAELAPRGSIEFHSGDMTEPMLGSFDHIVSMDALIHYRAAEMVGILSRFAPRARRSVLFTFAPSTPALATMHAVGRLFPKSDRAPAIEPIRPATLARMILAEPALARFNIDHSERISLGFYMSEAMRLVHK